MSVSLGRERLSCVEYERIIAILDDSIEKLTFLDSITPDVLQHRDELSKFIGDEISKTMAEQRKLEKKYEELIEQRAAMKGMVNKSKYKEVQEEIQEVSRALRESTNNLVRSLKENPNVSGNLLKVQGDRKELHDLLLRCCQELRDRGMYSTIKFKVDEEKNSRLRSRQLEEREESLRSTVAKLQKQLNEEKELLNTATTELRTLISRSKEELQSVKGSTSTDSRFKRKESQATVSSIWREFKHKERHLEFKYKELEEKLATEELVHKKTKEFLEKKHQSLLEEKDVWDRAYDTDVARLDHEMKGLTYQRTKLLENLHALQERKKIEEENCRLQKEKEDLDLLLQKEHQALTKKQKQAVRTIEREIKAYIKRKNEFGLNEKPTRNGKKKDKKDGKKN